MKRKEIQEVKRRSPEDLARLVKEGSEKLRGLKFELAAGKVKDVSAIRDLRKNIARMKTLIHQHQHGTK